MQMKEYQAGVQRVALAQMQPENEAFTCDCGGPVTRLTDDLIRHACGHKYAPLTSYYDGIQRPVAYRRVRVNPTMTDGITKYNWYVDWQTS